MMQNVPQRGRGVPLPPLEEKPWWKVIAPIGQNVLGVTFLDECWIGYPMHYVEEINKNLPCTQNRDCFMCRRGRVPRWSGYAAVHSANHRAEKILALTQWAAAQLLPYIERRGTLRGLVVDFQRRPAKQDGLAKRNDKVHVTVKGVKNAEILPPAFNVLPSLEKMWGCNLAFFSQQSPNFARLGEAPGQVERDELGEVG